MNLYFSQLDKADQLKQKLAVYVQEAVLKKESKEGIQKLKRMANR